MKERDSRIKHDKEKLKVKSGAHFVSQNTNINLNNYTNFSAISNDKLKEYQDNNKHLKNIANQMILMNNNKNKYWQIKNVHIVAQWLAKNFRDQKPTKDQSQYPNNNKNRKTNKNNLNSENLFSLPTNKPHKN